MWPVGADSNSYASLGAAVGMAARGCPSISNSFGGAEFNGETSYESHYSHPEAAITVSSGDRVYGAEFPPASGCCATSRPPRTGDHPRRPPLGLG